MDNLNKKRICGHTVNPTRDPTDLYPTPALWTIALLRNITFRGPVWEPAAGNGDMVAVLENFKYSVKRSDILTGDDFLLCDSKWKGSIVTNPPYKYANEFIKQSLNLASEQVALLLPLGSLGGHKRYDEIWSATPPTMLIVIVDRMPLIGGGHSQFNHVWAIWDLKISKRQTIVIWETVKPTQ